jgi:small multidrug resistance family-3 protein
MARSYNGPVDPGSPTVKTLLLFTVTAFAEIIGCFLPYLWLRKGGSAWLLLPAAASLALFAWLLTLHPTASGRVYAAYGGVYVTIAIGWLWLVEQVRPTRWDLLGALLCLAGMAVIMFSPRPA